MSGNPFPEEAVVTVEDTDNPLPNDEDGAEEAVSPMDTGNPFSEDGGDVESAEAHGQVKVKTADSPSIAPPRPSSAPKEEPPGAANYRSLLLTSFLMLLQGALVALLATSVAGSTEKPKVHGMAQEMYNQLRHIDYQSVSWSYFRKGVVVVDSNSTLEASVEISYDMVFGLQYGASQTRYAVDGVDYYLAYYDYEFGAGCIPDGQLVNSVTGSLTTMDTALSICTYNDLAITCKAWGAAATAYYSTAFTLSIISLILIFAQGMPSVGLDIYRAALNWTNLGMHVVALIFISATFGMSTNCVGNYADMVSGLPGASVLPTGMPLGDAYKISVISGPVYGCTSSAVALQMLQILLCIYLSIKEASDKKETDVALDVDRA